MLGRGGRDLVRNSSLGASFFFLFVIESDEQMSTLRPQFLLKFNFLIGENHLCHDLTESSSPPLLLPSRAVSDWQQ